MMVATAIEVSSCLASIAGAVATMADTPQMDVPTPSSVPSRSDRPMRVLRNRTTRIARTMQIATTSTAVAPGPQHLAQAQLRPEEGDADPEQPLDGEAHTRLARLGEPPEISDQHPQDDRHRHRAHHRLAADRELALQHQRGGADRRDHGKSRQVPEKAFAHCRLLVPRARPALRSRYEIT